MAYKDRIKDAEPPILPLRPLPPKWWLLAPCITAALAISQFVINWQHHAHSHVGYMILVAGLSMMVLLLTFAIVRVRLHVSKQAQRYLAELESLNRVSAAANSRLGEGQAALDELVKSICTLLDLREATVCLKDERDPILHFVSAYGMRVALRGRRVPLDRMKVVARCLQTKQMVAVDDISVTREPINREMAREQGMQATMVVPLIVTDRALGVLILGDLRPRKFTDAEKRLALLWAAQAAAVITSNNLFERARRALANRKSLQKRLDNLHAMLIKLYRSEDLHVALQDMADALPGVLEVDTCTISIVTEPDLDLTITAATTGKYPREIIGMRIPRNTINYSWQVLSSHRMSVIENAANDDRLNLSLRKQMEVGSIIFIPLYASNNRPIGLLSLIRRQPSVFSEEVRELADHLSRRAAHAIETATLHQQTRRDAETKTMLLRELNHRVKNNLAGIVALLSLEQPELPPRARQWLDRAIGRIQMMSRTHDLFGTGTTEVNLRRLIEMLVPSLVVICPPRAKIKTDIESIEVTLHPQRAVSLVMVLHELCYNALSYGVGADGVMLIRARGVDGYRIAIDVVDDGSGVSTGLPVATGPAALKSGSGLGLMLVRELVRTELHGVFSSAPNITGGLTATVEFPLKQKETELISL